MNIIINPGAGPVEGATLENATANIDRFISDLDLFIIIKAERNNSADHKGRFGFTLVDQDNGRRVEVEMPGLPLEQVRYISGDPWPFPRLYVDGSSWLWRYAIGIASDALEATDQPDEGEVYGYPSERGY